MQLSQFLICSAEMFSPARIEFISGSAEFRSQIGGIGLAGSRHNQKRGLTVDDRSLAVSSRTEIHASRRNLLALSRLLCEPMARLPVSQTSGGGSGAKRRFPISAITEL